MVEITPKTQVVGLVGHPVGHSLSPRFQNRIYERLGLDMVYLAFDVKDEDVGSAVEGMRALNYIGFNITIPHKEKVISHLDELDPEARVIGAVNTVKNDHGRLIGYNTDGQGFVYSLKKRGVNCRGKDIVILGAGGSARAIGVYLAKEEPRSISICNRTPERGRELAETINSFIGRDVAHSAAIIPEKCDIIVNTTPLGMWPKVEGNPLEGYSLDKSQVVCDIVYNPHMTRMLEAAAAKGCVIVPGIDMLLGQGIKAIEIWTGLSLENLDHEGLI